MVYVIEVLLTAEHSNGICHTGFADSWTQQWYMSYRFCWHLAQLSANLCGIIPLLCVQWKTPDDGQRNCPKHVEFYSKNKFEKLVHLVGFIIRIYHDVRSPERQISNAVFGCGRYVCYFQQDALTFAVTFSRLHLYISVQVVFTWLV